MWGLYPLGMSNAVTIRLGKKQIDWALWLLEKRYGALSPTELVMSAVKEIVADQSNRTSLEVSTPTTTPTKQKRAAARTSTATR